MEFCPVCKKLLFNGLWKGKEVAKCSCGFIRTSGFSLGVSESLEKNIIGSGFVEHVLSSSLESCGKCQSKNTQITNLGEAGSKENNILIIRCNDCGFGMRK